jgi:hypothetical protein
MIKKRATLRGNFKMETIKESAIQTQICNMLRAKGLMHFKICNEAKARAGIKSWGYWRKMKAEGLQAGVPDICVLFPNGGTVWIEVKRPATFKISEKTGKRIIASPAGKLSKEQQDWHDSARKLGHIVYTVHSVRAVEDILNEFLPRDYKIGGTI